jgi:glc operon protein GlcG
MLKASLLLSLSACLLSSVELPTRHVLNFATVRALATAAEDEAAKRNVHVSICIVDENGNLLFFERLEGASLNTVEFAQRKARHSAFYKSPSKNAADQVKGGNSAILAFPYAFPNQGGLPIKVGGETIGAIAVSGAASEVDEAIGQAALGSVLK